MPNPPRLKDLAARLAWARKVSGLTATALGERAGLKSKTHVGLIENRVRLDVEGKTIAKLAQALGISAGWLLCGEGEPPTESQIQQAVKGAA